MSLKTKLQKYGRDLRSFPHDAALGYRLDGMRGVWRTVAERSVQRVFRADRLILYAQSLDRIREAPLPSGVRIGPIQEEEWPALGAIVTQRKLPHFRARVEAGCHFLIAWRGPNPIGYAWVAERVTQLVSEIPTPLPDHAAYLWDLYVVPSERSNGVGSALAQARLRTAQALGYREGWRAIAPTNKASFRTLVKSGTEARVMGELRYMKVLSRLRTRFIPAPGSGMDAEVRI